MCDEKITAEEFISVKLKLDGDKGKMIVTDGNDKVLYTQEYGYSDAQKELDLFYTNKVLLLSREY